jgi:hypothetical protein
VAVRLLDLAQYLAQVVLAVAVRLQPMGLPMEQLAKEMQEELDLRVKIVVEVVARMLWAQVQLAQARQIRLAQVAQD